VTSDARQTEPATAESKKLRETIGRVRFVLWDLDGPICRLFAGHPAEEVARRMVELVDRLGLKDALTRTERDTGDPHVALLGVNRRQPGSDLLAELEEWLTREELEAVSSALPTPYADPLIRTWSAVGVRFAVTTNNSPLVAAEYVKTRGLADYFPHIHGRTQDLDLMKPDPHCLKQAMTALGADPVATLMIGDAPSDFKAARAAGVSFLGYARNEKKERELLDAGAGLVVRSLEQVLILLRGAIHG
jgi:HAD superfamily hydrolase (TIGR01509 family)